MNEKLKAKLLNMQQELKATKSQYNSFGRYNYRSCEDILEAVKPLLAKYKCILTMEDRVELIGDRYYLKAMAILEDTESEDKIEKWAFAREQNEKKGMDDSQVTGAASSYARKYALNGLFCIDDNKDADTDEQKRVTIAAEKKEPKKISQEQVNYMQKVIEENKIANDFVEQILLKYGYDKLEDILDKDYIKIGKEIKEVK